MRGRAAPLFRIWQSSDVGCLKGWIRLSPADRFFARKELTDWVSTGDDAIVLDVVWG